MALSYGIRIILIWILPAVILGVELTEFEKEYFGTVFTPYNKFHGDKLDYTLEEIETTLDLVSTKFLYISSYGLGTIDSTSHWNGTNHAEGRIALAAATLNAKKGNLSIIANIGIWTGGLVSPVTRNEVHNAFDAAFEANQLYKGTVSGIILTTHWDGQPFQGLLQSLTENRDRANNMSLSLGIRSSSCDSLHATSDPTAIQILSELDFIICHYLPNGPVKNISQAAALVGSNFLQWREGFKKFNISLTIGQTGWPSKETSKEGVTGSIENLVSFWVEMNKWAKTNHFRVDMFTAFDEPWKMGQMGAVEGHYGWWKRILNQTNGPEAFIEKIYYKEPGKTYQTEIGLGVFGGFILLGLILSIAFLYIRLKDVQSQLLTKADIEEFEKGKQAVDGDGTEDALRLPYDKSYEISKTKFIIDRTKLLGSGAFGTVYKGKLEDRPNDVAFKMTQPNCSANNLKSLLSEIKIMIHVGKHPNVVSIIGAYTGEMRQGMIMIAIELCDVSLEKHLRSNKHGFLKFSSATSDTLRYANDPTSNSKPVIQLQDLIKWSNHIASGMDHIASKNVIHADLAIRNVLLTSDGTAKITDFGLSRRLYEYTNYVKSNQEPLPWRWLAIESLQHMTFSTKSDVWAFGITLWEIFSLGDTPYPGLSWTVDFTQELLRGLRLSQPQYATPQIYSKMAECWNDDPEKRPDFADLKHFFEIVLEEITTLDYKNINSTYETNNDTKDDSKPNPAISV